MFKKISPLSAVAAFLVIALPASVFAHVSVKPTEVGVGKFQTFTTSVPNEKDNPTTKVRLVIPSDLKYVTPTVKTGWTIDVKKDGAGEEAKVSEITWSGGSIPAGFRDDFTFSAQAPAKESTLQWKAYQTYESGETVAWDQTPNADHAEGSTPYSETKVKNDLASTTTPKAEHPDHEDHTDQTNLALSMSGLALVVAAGGVVLNNRKK